MIRKLRLWWARRRLIAASKAFHKRLDLWKSGNGDYEEFMRPVIRRTAAAIERVNVLERKPGEAWRI